MNTIKAILRSALFIGLAVGCLFASYSARAAGGAGVPVPAILQKGFEAWAKNRNASWALDVWKIGSLMERDSKPSTLSRYFSDMDQTLGNYQSFEVVDARRISQTSEVLYLSVNFAHAAVFGRFLMYQTDKDWVVQNMDFSPKPEAMMPWLAFEGGSYGQ